MHTVTFQSVTQQVQTSRKTKTNYIHWKSSSRNRGVPNSDVPSNAVERGIEMKHSKTTAHDNGVTVYFFGHGVIRELWDRSI